MRSITIYSTEPCAHCRKAKALLERRGIAYREVNLAKDPDGRVQLAQRTGKMTFPQIMIGDEPLGGLDELVAADRDGRLLDAVA